MNDVAWLYPPVRRRSHLALTLAWVSDGVLALLTEAARRIHCRLTRT